MCISAFRSAALLLLLFLAAPALSQQTVTLQVGLPGYTGIVADTWISAANPTTNYGAAGGFNVVHETDTGGGGSGLVRFAIFQSEGGPVPAGATIISATLSLYKYDGAQAVIKASRLLKSWNLSSATWNLAAGGSSWTTAGANGAGSDYLASADGQASVGDAGADGCNVWPNFPAACWANIDVTSGVQAFANGTANHGWKIAFVSGTAPLSHKRFTASDHSTHAIARPKLTIVYDSGTTPPPWPTTQVTTMLQAGRNAYAGTTDTWISAANPTTNYGSTAGFNVVHETDSVGGSGLVRFAIFQSEGGPVPNGATINSATLSLYKRTGAQGVFKASRLLKNWNVSTATWNIAASGTSWTTAGANSAGSDYLASPDGQASVGDATADGCNVWPNFPEACWAHINVTSGVQAFASGTANHGWKIALVSGDAPLSHKGFTASDHATHSVARPKLTIVYTSPPGSSTPYSGTAIELPGTIEAENFDNGGQGVAYSDTTPANTGGQYRTSEAVDIIASAGGYVVKEFVNTEWMVYTVNVSASANYDIAVHASNTGPTAAFRIELNGESLVGKKAVPNTGSAESFQWVTASNVRLEKGTHRLMLAAAAESFNVNQISVTTSPTQPACTSGPYNGEAAEVPGTFEAENFDCGGQGVGYQDTDSVNQSGQYRPNEGVDIMSLSGGGYAVSHFAPGEWMVYSIDVPAPGGTYHIDIRAANANDLGPAAFRIEIDGVPVAGDVPVPSNGTWGTYQWFTKENVTLSPGQRRLKLVALQNAFRVDQLRIRPAGTVTPAPGGLLFWSGHEGGTTVATPSDCYPGHGPNWKSCWQNIYGEDSTGFSWPPNVWGGMTSRFQLLVDAAEHLRPITPQNVHNYMRNEIRAGEGRNGTRALYSSIELNDIGTTDPTSKKPQNTLVLEPRNENSDLYVSYWLKYPSDFVARLREGDEWRVVFRWKTPGDPKAEYSLVLQVVAQNGNAPHFQVKLDSPINNGSCESPIGGVVNDKKVCRVTRRDVEVPINEWFKVEVFWHRSAGDDGRIWVAVGIPDGSGQHRGVTLVDHYGKNFGPDPENLPIDRIFVDPVYHGGGYPISQWHDNLQIWDRFPTATPSDAWYDPPYAPH